MLKLAEVQIKQTPLFQIGFRLLLNLLFHIILQIFQILLLSLTHLEPRLRLRLHLRSQQRQLHLHSQPRSLISSDFVVGTRCSCHLSSLRHQIGWELGQHAQTWIWMEKFFLKGRLNSRRCLQRGLQPELRVWVLLQRKKLVQGRCSWR